MIQVREVFQLQFGRAREAIALAREGAAIEARHGGVQARILTDLTGDYYTLVLESDHESLAAFERFWNPPWPARSSAHGIPASRPSSAAGGGRSSVW